ncbi:MAG: hypothetical protein JSS81_05215 [Acidobacteria bacterium]|nr:hypothetical protein [Acidobacteriota bacterium]
MSRRLLIFIIFVLTQSLAAQVNYSLTYGEDSRSVAKISVELPAPASGAASFVMPRSIPGEYSISSYDAFVENIAAVTASGERIALTKNEFDAPRWQAVDNVKPIIRIEYEVDLRKMERKMPPGSASAARDGFAGILNYSIFGWVEGTENQPVHCRVKTSKDWPVFSTNRPAAAARKGEFGFDTENYYELADGQIFLGPRFRVKEFKGPVPLFVASFCEPGDEFLDDYGKQGVRSLEILNDYFGEIPFRHYSIMLVRAIPLEAGTAPQLAMEHLASATFFGDTVGMRKAPLSDEELNRSISPYLHHMAHAYIPLRSYGDAYRPIVQEIPPIIRNIWFNEGFMWFLAYDTLKFERMLTVFKNGAFNTSETIKKMNLTELSQLGSTAYGTDFRIGRALYSRGALMAIEMNESLLKKSGGKKSMKDVIRALYYWGKQNRRAFTMDEFPRLINRAGGINLQKIYEKWQLPVATE